MFRKIQMGMLAFFGVCVIASAGYQFGQYLAERNQSTETPAATTGASNP